MFNSDCGFQTKKSEYLKYIFLFFLFAIWHISTYVFQNINHSLNSCSVQPIFAQRKQAHLKNLKYWYHQKNFEKEIIINIFEIIYAIFEGYGNIVS